MSQNGLFTNHNYCDSLCGGIQIAHWCMTMRGLRAWCSCIAKEITRKKRPTLARKKEGINNEYTQRNNGVEKESNSQRGLLLLTRPAGCSGGPGGLWLACLPASSARALRQAGQGIRNNNGGFQLCSFSFLFLAPATYLLSSNPERRAAGRAVRHLRGCPTWGRAAASHSVMVNLVFPWPSLQFQPFLRQGDGGASTSSTSSTDTKCAANVREPTLAYEPPLLNIPPHASK